MDDLPLACTVRNCSQPLRRQPQAWTCSRGHTFDIARSGYVNLLQPQDRQSLAAGDSKAAVEARAELLEAGVGRALLDEIVAEAAALPLPDRAVAADLGSGSGEALAALTNARPIAGIGIDLSTAAAEHAARRFPGVTWVVANADRQLPLLDRRVNLVLSLHGRRNPSECARALAPAGLLLVTVPAADDLIELREFVLGGRVERDRAAGVIAEHQLLFNLKTRRTVRERHDATRQDLLNLLRGTYRGERLSASDRIKAITRLDVTLVSEILVFEAKQ